MPSTNLPLHDAWRTQTPIIGRSFLWLPPVGICCFVDDHRFTQIGQIQGICSPNPFNPLPESVDSNPLPLLRTPKLGKTAVIG